MLKQYIFLLIIILNEIRVFRIININISKFYHILLKNKFKQGG